MANYDSVKKFLHAWLGHRRLGAAIYQERGQYVESGIGTVFMSEVRSDRFANLVGVGRGQTKKAAMEKAARDLCVKLMNIGRMDKADFMSLKIQRDGIDGDQSAAGGPNPNPPVPRREIDQSPMAPTADTDETGWEGWTLDDYETVFDQICQAKHFNVTYKYIPVGFGEHSIIAELNFTTVGSQTPGIVIYARAEDKTMKVARGKCTKKAVLDLYNKKLIDVDVLAVNRTREESSGRSLSSAATEPAVSSTIVQSPPNTSRAIKQEIDVDSGEASGNIGEDGPSTSASNQNEAVEEAEDGVVKKRGRGRPPKSQRGRH